MNIYIYGSKSFKKEIHTVLDHSNIKFKLDEDSLIKDIDSLDELKFAIENSPHDIYLIEEEKIIKRNSLNSKVKFLSPKDAIDENFLLEHSIPDITIDSLEDLPKYIIKKHDEYLEKYEHESIVDEIKDIVDDAYFNNSENEDDNLIDEDFKTSLVEDNYSTSDKIDDFSSDGLNEYNFKENIEKQDSQNLDNDDSIEYESLDTKIQNDEIEMNNFDLKLQNLDDLLDENNNETPSFDNDLNLDALENILEESKDELEEEIDLDELDNLLDNDNLDSVSELENNESSNLSLEFENSEEKLKIEDDEELLDNSFFEELENNFEELEENNDKIQEDTFFEDKVIHEESKDEINLGDEQMNDDFSQLDMLNEEDLLNVLNDTNVPVTNKAVQAPNNNISNDTVLEVSGNSIDELSKIFSQLLKNKTIEITIKIKD